MNRRDLLQSAGAITLAAVAESAFSADEHAHHHHDHGGGSKFKPLVSASSDCVATGEACVAHCLVLLGQGDKVMAACAQSVSQLIAVCGALEKLAAQQSKHTAALSKLALEVCGECEKECRKHESKHAECKACADSCAECIKQCKAFSA
jgi:Cys-rich four helix bundle protein (predicted Tat secretion target)